MTEGNSALVVTVGDRCR